MKKFIALIILFIGLILPQQNDLLTSVQKKFNSTKDFSVDFQQVSGGRIAASGKFFFKQKKKTRIELGDILLVTDGKTTYSFNNKTKKLIISDYDDSDPSMVSLDAIINDYPSICSIAESIEKKIITVEPKNSSLTFKQVKLFVTDSFLISKIEITNFDGQTIWMNFSNYKTNIDLSDNLFLLEPEPGTKVIDLR